MLFKNRVYTMKNRSFVPKWTKTPKHRTVDCVRKTHKTNTQKGLLCTKNTHKGLCSTVFIERSGCRIQSQPHICPGHIHRSLGYKSFTYISVIINIFNMDCYYDMEQLSYNTDEVNCYGMEDENTQSSIESFESILDQVADMQSDEEDACMIIAHTLPSAVSHNNNNNTSFKKSKIAVEQKSSVPSSTVQGSPAFRIVDIPMKPINGQYYTVYAPALEADGVVIHKVARIHCEVWISRNGFYYAYLPDLNRPGHYHLRKTFCYVIEDKLYPVVFFDHDWFIVQNEGIIKRVVDVTYVDECM